MLPLASVYRRRHCKGGSPYRFTKAREKAGVLRKPTRHATCFTLRVDASRSVWDFERRISRRVGLNLPPVSALNKCSNRDRLRPMTSPGGLRSNESCIPVPSLQARAEFDGPSPKVKGKRWALQARIPARLRASGSLRGVASQYRQGHKLITTNCEDILGSHSLSSRNVLYADEASRPAAARQKSPERDSSLRCAALRMTAWQTSAWTSGWAA